MESGKRRALITGVTGQDGSYLAELLLEKGYEVHGFARRQTKDITGVVLHLGDLADRAALGHALAESDPHEIYNLGAQSHVAASFREPAYTFEATALPLVTILEHVRASGVKAPWSRLRVYQASSSELFGDAPPPQNENSPFRPRSPYAIAKLAAHRLVGLYREAYGVFAVAGILHNHESERRAHSFVTRKITLGVGRVFRGEAREIVLGNLDAKRDWSHAADMVKGMWLMLQQETPKDYVLASGSAHSVRDFVEVAFRVANEITGRDLRWQDYVKTDPRFLRPAEVPHLLGNATRACQELGWRPEVNFEGLVRLMVEHDLGGLTR
jgi:GDPmannose 4,6-dehydratase